MICFPVTRHVEVVGSAQERRGDITSRPRDVVSSAKTMSVRDAASLGSRAVSSAVRPDEARGGRKASSRGRPAREENILDEEKRGVCATLPDHLIGLHGGRSPGPLAGRALSADSVPCAGPGVLAREWLARALPPSEITPAALGSRRRNFSQPGASNRRAVWPCFANIWFALKRERAPRVGHYRSFDRARGVSNPGHENAIARISEFARGVSRTDPG